MSLRRWGVLAAVTVVLVLTGAAPASAHAGLVDTDPDQGAVLETVPDVVTLTFSEPVRGVPDGVQVFDAAGNSLESSSHTRDRELLVTLEGDVGEGTLAVAWRVISADGHPIAGTLTFSIGVPSEEVVAPAVGSPDDGAPLALSLSRWPAYAGLLLAVGLVWFATLLVPAGLDRIDRSWRRLVRAARAAAVVSGAAWLVGIPLTAEYLRGSGLGSFLERATWASLPVEEVGIALATVVGVVTAAWLLSDGPGRTTRHQLAALAGLLALAPLPLSGHTRAEAENELLMVVDWLHLAAGSVWLGGLVGLALTLPSLAGRREAGWLLLSRFSSAAASVLAALVLSGAFLAWRIVGSWSLLVDDDYGRLLLVKIGVAATAAGLAAYNRFQLLPHVRDAAGFHDRVASTRALSRTATLEAGVLVAVLLVTGFLVQKSPPSEQPGVAAGGSQTRRTDVGDLQATLTLSPATSGLNTVTLRLRDAGGRPAEGVEPPRVRISSGRLAGEVPLARLGPGVFQGRIPIPRDGAWTVQVSVRLSKFDNPVASVDFDVAQR